MLPAPWLLGLGLVVALLVMIPARRLQLGGFSRRTIGLYALGVWLLAMTMAVRPIGIRLLLPFLLVAYLAPFVGAPEQVRRVVRRERRPRPGQPPIKDVTPPEERERIDGDDGSDRS
jgi:hypothetical protein